MPFRQIDDREHAGIEYVDVGPNKFHKTTKMVWENNEWVEKKFVRLYAGSDKTATASEMEKWCIDHYGSPKANGRWFKVSGYIVMEEKVYVHWKLCE